LEAVRQEQERFRVAAESARAAGEEAQIGRASCRERV
jgi:hypothetical protein